MQLYHQRSGEKSREAHDSPLIPYPQLEHHGLIGDRRTAALVAADGTLDWLSLTDYDGPIIFGALLDCSKGGFWRLGPTLRALGCQSYLPGTMVLETMWTLEQGILVLQDTMLWPESNRAPHQQDVRTIVRFVRCTEGKVRCRFDLEPAFNFRPPENSFAQDPSGFSLQLSGLLVRVWASIPLQSDGSYLRANLELKKGDEIWAVVETGAAGHCWTAEAAGVSLKESQDYWHNWLASFNSKATKEKQVQRAAMLIHLLTYAPEGSAVAAPTTSVPERIGGDWNADYRLCWVRDASLALGLLAQLGNCEEVERYLQWLVKRQSRYGQPLQVLYDIRGGKRPNQRKLREAIGYRASAPVRIGNHAYKQHQVGSLGFLADCAWL